MEGRATFLTLCTCRTSGPLTWKTGERGRERERGIERERRGGRAVRQAVWEKGSGLQKAVNTSCCRFRITLSESTCSPIERRSSWRKEILKKKLSNLHRSELEQIKCLLAYVQSNLLHILSSQFAVFLLAQCFTPSHALGRQMPCMRKDNRSEPSADFYCFYISMLVLQLKAYHPSSFSSVFMLSLVAITQYLRLHTTNNSNTWAWLSSNFRPQGVNF